MPNKTETNSSVYGIHFSMTLQLKPTQAHTNRQTNIHTECVCICVRITQIASDAFNFLTRIDSYWKSRDVNSIWVLKLIAYSWAENFFTVLCTLESTTKMWILHVMIYSFGVRCAFIAVKAVTFLSSHSSLVVVVFAFLFSFFLILDDLTRAIMYRAECKYALAIRLKIEIELK